MFNLMPGGIELLFSGMGKALEVLSIWGCSAQAMGLSLPSPLSIELLSHSPTSLPPHPLLDLKLGSVLAPVQEELGRKERRQWDS